MTEKLNSDDYEFAAFHIVNRFANAESWWIASELAHRHPELVVHEMHPGGGQYDVLCVTSPDQLRLSVGFEQPKVMLNRAGSLQLHGPFNEGVIATWYEAFESSHPHQLVWEIEERTRWGRPVKTPATTLRSLTYRIVASALRSLINDKLPWDVRCEAIDSSDSYSPTPRHGFINLFEGAIEHGRLLEPIGLFDEPFSQFWALLRGKDPVALLSLGGIAFLRDGAPIDLMAVYRKTGRSVRRTTCYLLDQLGA